jgi:hypothetical protein
MSFNIIKLLSKVAYTEQLLQYRADIQSRIALLIEIQRAIKYGVFRPQSNDRYRGPTKLVLRSAYRASSQRRKGAANHLIEMVWLNWGSRILFTCSNDDYLPSRRLEKGEGGE